MASLIPSEPSTSTLWKPASSSLAATLPFVVKRLNPDSEHLAMYYLPLRTVYVAMKLPPFASHSCILQYYRSGAGTTGAQVLVANHVATASLPP
jgi:hypothetical protein